LKVKVLPFFNTSLKVKVPYFYLSTVTHYFYFVTVQPANNACILLVVVCILLVIVFTNFFWKYNYTVHTNLCYYLYLISLKLYRIILLKIVRNVENILKIENTGYMHCPVLLSFLYRTKSLNTGLSVKHRTPGNPIFRITPKIEHTPVVLESRDLRSASILDSKSDPRAASHRLN